MVLIEEISINAIFLIKKIADKAGYNTATIYNYFEDAGVGYSVLIPVALYSS